MHADFGLMTGSPGSRVAVTDGVEMVTGEDVYAVGENASGTKKESPMLDWVTATDTRPVNGLPPMSLQPSTCQYQRKWGVCVGEGGRVVE